ncbi:hypothetical protein C3L23_06005 [Nautilia sp. PV-1]|uniref:tail protein X n=1 Tax=Nautilia sp. PV-1 TaxID=2579250 RepID=UPI000FD6DF50|nr:tail protein X [Nautilia sp. PV-1]AZV46839.1 hypothetical protein C3L23_06005 [Nautilia sp. PV-1]
MIEIKLIENKRLDQVVYENLGTLDNFEEILELNKHLIEKEILDIGDIVYLPEPVQTNEKIVEEKALW